MMGTLETKRTMSQTDMIREHLMEGHTITATEALSKFGCFRLAARIKDLRDGGMEIVTINDPHDGGNHAMYRRVG